jgi:tetratricopeptide (TPR) repeat protein
MNESGTDKPGIVLAYVKQCKLALVIFAGLLIGCAAGSQFPGASTQSEAQRLNAEARAAAENGEYAHALELLMEALAMEPDPAVARRAAHLASAVEDWPTAAGAAETWLQLSPGASQARQIATVAAFRQGSVERGVELLQGGLDDEAFPMDWTTAVALLAASGSDETANSALERLIDQAGDLAPGYGDYLRSRLAWQFDHPERAFELAQRALQAAPDHERALWAARLAQAGNLPERALAYYRQAAAFDPEDSVAALAEVELLEQLGRGEQALKVLDRLPVDAEILYARGLLQQELGRLAGAGVTWHRLASLPPERAGDRHAWLTAVLAEILELKEESIEWYARVEGELSVRADLRRAALLAGRDQLEQARALLAGVRAEADAELAEQAWLIEAKILSENDRTEDAIALLGKALIELPGSAALLYGRAMAAVEKDNLSLAEQDLRTIIQNNPENAWALNALGYTLSDRTDRQREALRLIETALALEPANPAILDSMGWVLYKLGRAEEGLPYLRRAAEAEPHAEIVAHLVEVLWNLDQRGEALEWIARTRGEMGGEEVYAATLARIGVD